MSPQRPQAQAPDPISCCYFLPGHFPLLCPSWGRKKGETHLAVACFGLTDLRVAMAAAAFAGAQVEPTRRACVAGVTVLGAGRWQWEELPQQDPFWTGTTGWRGWGRLGKVEKAKGSTMKGAGWTGVWDPGLTWQDGPRYPVGQVHCSTSSAWSWPVSSGTATSMLMPEILGVTKPYE